MTTMELLKKARGAKGALALADTELKNRALIVSNLKWGGPCRDHYVLTRETLSGRRPADGADTPGGVFRSGENLPGEGDTIDIFRRSRRE